ncbi:hypothetical protein BDV96DRAFT_482125 [Lophiotrema nucula]|uniref:Amine oxidase domain-containing protein n=1 Tax=Lophiotrema nucula TaxID=690887 RepID=A0A6A5ZV65_9PLEO|nr:hypothetical protein BDV96DRAFT_482125 [Lophiotrema nucula]
MISRVIGRIPHVGIVGAGVAGLRCADVLLQHGVKVTILEGRNRVGGRFCQSDALGHKVDLGPNWIHGTDNNPMLDLAKETRTITMTFDGRQSIFDEAGKHMPEQDAAELTELTWTIIENAMHYSNEKSAEIPATKSLYNYFEDNVVDLLKEANESISDKELMRKRETVLHMSERWGAFVGSPVQRQSLKFFWLEECIDGENLFVAETYHKVLAKVAEPALKGAKIHFEHVVNRIESKGPEEQPSVSVELEGKESLTFDEIVHTAPLGWLQRNQDSFVPKLPERLSQAIDAISYGHLDKVYITFPTAFWNQPSDASTFIPSIPHQETAPNVSATTAPLHQPPPPTSTTTKPLHYPGFTHWTSPHYAPDTNPEHWVQEAMNFAALPGSTAHPTLLFYIFGPTALHIASLMKPFSSPFDPEAQALLTTFFEPYYSRLPHYDPSNPNHKPTKLLATLWANDELAGYGSYSNFQVGLERGDQDIEVMRRGVPERGLWLAGEHTAPFVALGTVTGAWWAGEGVARRILKAYGLGKEGDGVEGSGDGRVDRGAESDEKVSGRGLR